MKLHVDLESLQLIQGPGQRSAVASLRFKRGDAAQLQVVFLENGVNPATIGNPNGLEIQIGIKPRNQFDRSYLAQSTNWLMPSEGDDTPTYGCVLSFNTLQLNSALNVGSESAEELHEITLMGEITWREGSGEPTSTRTFLVVVENDVNRGTEGVPVNAEPPYPSPQNLVTLDILGDLAVRHDMEQSLGVSDQLQARLNIGAAGTADGFVKSPTPSGFQIRNHLSATVASFGTSAPGYTSASFTGSMSVAGSISVSGSFYGSSVSAANVATSGSISSNTTVSAASLVMTGDVRANVFLQSLIPSGLLSTAINNVGVGNQALASLTSGARNTAVGRNALNACSTGLDNTGIGHSALSSINTGSYNAAVGSAALQSCTQGMSNAACGMEALQNLTTVAQNSALGNGALRYITVGAGNTGIGFRTGHANVAGQQALTQGKNNTLLGNSAGVNVDSRSQSIALGYRATTETDGELAIGAATAAIKGGATGTAYNSTSHGITHTVTAPANPTTPVGWLDARINGTLFKIPLYQ